MARRVAGMHEQRDRSILTVQRLMEAEGSVMKRSGFNPRKVRLPCRINHIGTDSNVPSKFGGKFTLP